MTTERGTWMLYDKSSERTDAQLWETAQSGDRPAFEGVFRRHHRAVWNHALRLTASSEGAEDVTSATFLIAWQRLGEVRLSHDSARPWLLGVATNLSHEHRRQDVRLRRVAVRVGVPPDVADHAGGVAAMLDDESRLRRVLTAIDNLPARLRNAVCMHLVGGLTTAETACALGLTDATVRARISRARLRLRTQFQEDQ